MAELLAKAGKGKVVRVLVDNEDAERVSAYYWQIDAWGYVVNRFIVARTGYNRYRYKNCRLHQLLLGCPLSGVIDHINGNPLDNRRSNLRIVSNRQNAWNSRMKSTNASGFIGVSYRNDTKKWGAWITIEGQSVSLGTYLSAEDAAYIYDQSAFQLRGKYARLNFPF